jgi:SAM-dependent methyltransferase
MANRPYQYLATYYDMIFADQLNWRESARQPILGKLLPQIESICDLGCGTGTAAAGWARRGLNVYGVDLSPAMCELARKKARQQRVAMTIIEADMRKFRLPEPVDLVSCEFDAINHVPKRSDLALVTRAVARALKPGGHFYFDVNTRLSFEKIWPVTWWIEKNGVILVMRGGYDPSKDPDRAFVNAEFFVKKGRCWHRFTEHVEEICWSNAEIKDTLGQAGFDRIRSWDATRFFQDDPFMRKGYRTFYLARKREN